MGFSIGVIAIKGDHLDKAARLFSAFGYEDKGESKTFNTLAEAGEVLYDNYLQYSHQSIALRGLWIENGWTIICDPEIVDLWQDDKISSLSSAIGADIWTIAIQTTSGTYSFSKFNPQKVRHFFVSDGEIAENEGAPLSEEAGLNINEKIFVNDLISLAKKLGFEIESGKSGQFFVRYLPYGEQMKAELAQYTQQTKSQSSAESKPWWKFW